MKKENLKSILEVFLTLQVTKELPRQGFLYSGFKRNEADSVAAHSYNVAVLAYFLARELKISGKDVDPNRTLKIAIFHDMGEAITGDIGTYVKDLAGGVFDEVENKSFKLLVRNISNKNELIKYFEEYQERKSIESQIVKVADALDALAQGLGTPGAKMTDWERAMESISKKKIKDKELSKLFLKSVNLMIKREVTYFRDHIEKENNSPKKL